MFNKFRRHFLKTSIASMSGIIAIPEQLLGSSNKDDQSYQSKQSGGNWKCLLTLNNGRKVTSGSAKLLADAIRKGADLRIYTEFRNNEHIDTKSSNKELIKEVADFRVTYLLDDRWVAGIINLRQPIELPNGFGPRPSMSFFLYNQNADQAIARPYLDGQPASGRVGPGVLDDHSDMPKYHQFDAWDSGTNAPSSNFVYDFETYKFWVCDNWEEVYSNNAQGEMTSGSLEALVSAFENGREVKIGITGLCDDVVKGPKSELPHEVFVQCGSCYYYTESKKFCAASQPVVRVKPAIPLRYKSEEWDFGWLMPRSDGHLARWLLDPYTLKFKRTYGYYAMRWFVR